MVRAFLASLVSLLAGCLTATAAEPPLAAVTVVGPAEPVFVARQEACDGHDVPDAPLRAFRDERGGVVAFGLHYRNRALRGDSLDRLAIDCAIVLDSSHDPDPAAYDDRSWITATWTEDGRAVAALVHHEYHADDHPGRCRFDQMLACWTNTILALDSPDGGRSFPRPEVPQVVAAFPFRQEAEQGRHRGFFNPSNIVAHGRYRYMFTATTGWTGQDHGACLFRTDDPFDPTSWRAFDGSGFTVRYGDPYRSEKPASGACQPIAPFPAPLGSVVRHRPTGAFIAVFQAKAEGEIFPQSGFYVTASRDLVTWDKPRLLMAGATLYEDPCGSGGRIIAYPSLLDPKAEGRNFDDVGDTAQLYFATLRVNGCEITSDRDLVRRRVAIKVWP